MRIRRQFAAVLRCLGWLSVLMTCGGPAGDLDAAEPWLAGPARDLIQQFCFDCHDGPQAEAQLDLRGMAAVASFDTRFKDWRKVTAMLRQRKMPPSDAPSPSDSQRSQLLQSIDAALQQAAQQYASDPGEPLMRRLTSAEYTYSIQDLTGLDLHPLRDDDSDAVGGEGFTNQAAVQFVQDSTLQRYLQAARAVAAHLVIGTGPLQFYEATGETGLELSAITRIRQIYRDHGFRSAAGEGGEPFGLDRYPKAFFAAWQYQHRHALGLDGQTFHSLAEKQHLDARFVEYIWSVMNQPTSAFPMSEIVERWRALPEPAENDPAVAERVRQQCHEVYGLLRQWQDAFGQNADDKEQAFALTADSFQVSSSKSFVMSPIEPDDSGKARLYLQVQLLHPLDGQQPAIVWQNPSVQFRIKNQRLRSPRPLREILSAEEVQRLPFTNGNSNETDLVTHGNTRLSFTLPLPSGATSARLTVTARLDDNTGSDCIVRCSISEVEDPKQGQTVIGLLADPDGPSFQAWRPAVIEFARTFPQISHREPAPSDRDPIPPPFDNTYNNPQRNHFHARIKYHRDDQFLVDNMLDDATRLRLEQAWRDLWGSFDYHEAWLDFIARNYDLQVPAGGLDQLDSAWVTDLPPEPRRYVTALVAQYRLVEQSFAAARAGHLDDLVVLATRAWRRPLSDDERERLRRYYQQLRSDLQLDHDQAVREVLMRILVAPEFIYRAERPPEVAGIVPLSDWELASRLSYFLWSSLPDDQLCEVSAAGRLNEPEELTRQARRMLADPRARRLAQEFFGQWLGFYRFDRYRGVDPQQFPEFDDELREAMHDEAVALLDHIIRQNRPVDEILFADYTFVNARLARHYGMNEKNLDDGASHRVDDAGRFHRGGVLGLGSLLTVTSAPLRTSPVKRGDWVLRRLLGTPVPPPPADAGSIPADDPSLAGETIRQRLQAHRRQASCQNCHARIDPLGFTLEQYDALGRWREQYAGGQPIDTSGQLPDDTVITGPDGLRRYLADNKPLFQRTLCTKLVGYALGRGESICDAALIERMLDGLERDERFGVLVEAIVTSDQFRKHWGAHRPTTQAVHQGDSERSGPIGRQDEALDPVEKGETNDRQSN